ncbi:MAG TPA: OmpA family protein [Myxococcota bacterium]|jgi:outer membrane protein OmpA-like peptidoglycan-associated protein
MAASRRCAALLVAIALAAAAAGAEPVETETPGVTAELLELRQARGLLRLAIRIANTTAAPVSGATPIDYDAVTLTNSKTKQKHFALKDAGGHFLAGPVSDWNDGGRWWLALPAKSEAVLWALFEPVAPGALLSVALPGMFPFDDVPVTEGASAVFRSDTAGSTPAGVAAKIVSARRSEKELKLRLKLEQVAGEPLDVPALVYGEAFALDPASKRKYPVLKDTEGSYQGQPQSDSGDGGRFWLHSLTHGVPVLMSLTFQAPPDEVTQVDLGLPNFLLFEAVPIEGLGGADAGGIAAGGKTLGLEGALKELKAEVTPQEIKIDLSADVLFDFDKAELKPAAEQQLGALLTVVNSRPNATVAIEGHTDLRGDEAYNQALSERRAQSVRAWLISRGVAAGRITAAGAGESRPVRTGNTEPDHQANRRVEIRIRGS